MPSLNTNTLRKKMQAVGVKSAEYQHLRADINKMLDDDHSMAEPCCRLLRSGLLKVVLETTFEKMIPACDTRFGLLSKTVKMKVLKALAPEKLTKDVASAIQKMSASLVNELFLVALAADKATPVIEHAEKVCIQDMVFRHSAWGGRLQQVEIDPTGNIDWNQIVIYALVPAVDGPEAKIQHKPTKTEVALPDDAKVDRDWSFGENRDEKATYMEKGSMRLNVSSLLSKTSAFDHAALLAAARKVK